MKNAYAKLFLYIFFDVILAAISFMTTILISNQAMLGDWKKVLFSIAFVSVITVLFSYIFRTYHILWRFAGYYDYLRMVATAFITTGGYVVANSIYLKSFDASDFMIFFFTLASLLCVYRFLIREIAERNNATEKKEHNEEKMLSGNIMVIGGGSAGSEIINDINVKNRSADCAVKCVIDDDPEKIGKLVAGVLIVGDINEIPSAVKKYDIDMIIFAIPSCSADRKAAIMRICQKTNCKLRIMPSLHQLIVSDDAISAKVIRKVEIEDLLGREPIALNVDKVMDYVENNIVLVTGGGGSIGSELCRQIAAHNPKRLIILDVYENNAYDISNELRQNYPNLDLVTLIGSVRDSKRMESVFKKYSPEIVYHAAAHKHVPLMEDSPNEAIKNNVFGTYKTADCAGRYGAKKFILISTDKAVNPTNIMGASKRICEMIVQTMNDKYDTDFAAVRFGNVLGSNGSVIPLFKNQIAKGGPVTVTDPNIIRYFMTIPEAVSLVLQAGATAKGGEIFVLDMGEPVKILELAENIIRLSGFEPYTDIKIKFTGLRPGEKLYEELLMSEEGLKGTENSLIHIGKPIDIDVAVLEKTLEEMKNVMYNDNADVRALVKQIVPTYTYRTSPDTQTATN